MNQGSRGSAGPHLIQPRGAAGEGFPVRENTASSCQPCPETVSCLRGGSAPPRPPARVARTEASRGYSTPTPGFQVYSQCPASSNRILNFPGGSGACPAPSTPLPGRPGRALRARGKGDRLAGHSTALSGGHTNPLQGVAPPRTADGNARLRASGHRSDLITGY